MEIIWIVAGLVSMYAAIHTAVSGGGGKIIIFAGMTLISFLFALLRHKQRKKS